MGKSIDVPIFTANIFAAAINRTKRQNKADWLGRKAGLPKKMSMLAWLQNCFTVKSFIA